MKDTMVEKQGDIVMKIDIMDYWWSNDNFGQLLQCYTLQKCLRDAGHDVYLT